MKSIVFILTCFVILPTLAAACSPQTGPAVPGACTPATPAELAAAITSPAPSVIYVPRRPRYVEPVGNPPERVAVERPLAKAAKCIPGHDRRARKRAK